MSKKHWENDFVDEDTGPSKSDLKRGMLALQKLGETIVKLSKGDLKTIPMEHILADAVNTARRIKSREGLRRQMQYIGKLMRTTDIQPIEQALHTLENGRKELAEKFHQVENWRDQLIELGPNSIEQVVEIFPQAERQHLRQLIMQAIKEKKASKPPAASRKLFRYLRELGEQ
jgi:ribosome-associated protein